MEDIREDIEEETKEEQEEGVEMTRKELEDKARFYGYPSVGAFLRP